MRVRFSSFIQLQAEHLFIILITLMVFTTIVTAILENSLTLWQMNATIITCHHIHGASDLFGSLILSASPYEPSDCGK